ncbi:nitrate- and nitrite sensing domain-containing protein [Dactylosporangium aurantiacum]|uniref:histidine kinase n=1 Tax=Dactylosporangium aurantiacum TaxID=35754 RepID=A0A9Q9I9H6_9ACTN|nr:nitrate- and nitrite sensing domain-containing protein [Dactylosporangium aurantiacum]MDG6109254.1 nitrate- and nitrite sensing domain-containing protein [Dactylosporangium aurantiacum]UWZ50345.1 nitrate- and nitrite sensing domain-containing protein [Dactylosporangium aurantiacum]
MNNRWSIRAKINAMLAIPIVMLAAIWLFAVSFTLEPALDLRNSKLVGDKVTEPAEAMVEQLQVERQLTTVYVAGGRKDAAAVREQRAKTDAAVAQFRTLASDGDLQDVATQEAKQAIASSTKALDGLAQLRQQADGGGQASVVRQAYSAIITGTYGIAESVTNHQDSEVTEEATGVFVLGLSRDLFSQEDALVTEAAVSGVFTAAAHTELVALVGQQRLILPYGVTLLAAETQAQFGALAGGGPMSKLTQLENQLLATAPGPAEAAGIDLRAWRAAFDPVNVELRNFRTLVQRHNVQAAQDASDAIFLRLGVAGALGLLAVVLSLVLSVRIGRSLARRLDGLRVAALELADERLPSVVSRLRRGVQVDVAAEAPPLRLGTDEIGQVGEAFNSVQRTAVASAVEESSVRQGMNEVFLNIARRSQTLLHRQLSLLDGMERRTSEPDDLADLFRVDHLATRMRRHAEDLVILAGAAPGRGWRNPVSVIDVVRGAVSEVEDYARVQVQQVGEGAVVGRAVGDIIHLLAELIENATAFSPPHTRVNVTGQLVPNGFVIEIEDRGLGMSVEAIAEANRRLVEPPEFDPANSARLGLFVVAQLAARHGVRVVLRSSPFGGVTAVALLPTDLVVAQPAVAPLPAGVPADLSNTRELQVVAREPFSWLPVDGAGEVGEHTQVLPASSIGRRPALSVVQEPPAGDGRRPGPGPLPRQRPVGRSDVSPGSPAGSPAGRADADDGPPARPAVVGAGGGVSSAGPRGLPKRVRQQSLAPQLQQDAVAGDAQEAEVPQPGRSPEQLRRMMSSFQAGTARGRHASAGDSDSDSTGSTGGTDSTGRDGVAG